MELVSLDFLKKLHLEIIDGVESGVNSEYEKAEVLECIEELEFLEKDFEYKNIHFDNLVNMHKIEVKNILNRCCSECIYANKINKYTFICKNDFSPTNDLVIDSSFSCKLWRNA